MKTIRSIHLQNLRFGTAPFRSLNPKRSAAALTAAFAMAVLLLTAGLAAGQAAPNRGTEPDAPVADDITMGGGERLADTLAKCLADLESENPETRRAAVLLLGKYEVPTARAALIKTLRDPEAAVRRATVVSLVESFSGLMMAAPALLPLLGDEDVHIRRMISARLPELAGRGLAAMRAPPSERPPDMVKAIRQAFADPDEAVRHNMLSAYHHVQAFVDQDVVLPFLQETNPALRVMALQTLWRSRPVEAVITKVLFLANDPEPDVRLQLIRSLARHSTAESGPTLLALTADPDAAVAGEAILAALRGGVITEMKPITDYLARPDVDRTLGTRIIATLSGTDVAATPLLRDTLRHPVPEFQAAAIQALVLHDDNELDTAALMAFLDDPAPEIRRGAGLAITQYGVLDQDTLHQLAGSTYPDVRELLVPASRRLGDEPAAALLDELLIDELPAIRNAVIGEFARRQLNGWIEITGRALLDGAAVVRNTARTSLMQSRPPEARSWIERAIERIGDDAERDQLRRLLQSLDTPRSPPNSRPQPPRPRSTP